MWSSVNVPKYPNLWPQNHIDVHTHLYTFLVNLPIRHPSQITPKLDLLAAKPHTLFIFKAKHFQSLSKRFNFYFYYFIFKDYLFTLNWIQCVLGFIIECCCCFWFRWWQRRSWVWKFLLKRMGLFLSLWMGMGIMKKRLHLNLLQQWRKMRMRPKVMLSFS